jgi:hypothetical protein
MFDRTPASPIEDAMLIANWLRFSGTELPLILEQRREFRQPGVNAEDPQRSAIVESGTRCNRDANERISL